MEPDQATTPTSPLAALDDRTKLLGILAYSVVVAVLKSHSALGLSLGLSLAMALFARPSAAVFLRRLLAFNLFLAFLWLFIPWGMPGEHVLRLGRITVSREGIDYMAAMTLRANALMIGLMAFMASTTIASITHAMAAFKIPDKITYLFFLTYRYIGEISSERTRLVNAMKVRCFRPSTSMHTYRSYAYLVGMLLANSFERAQRVRAAMLCRGFNGRFPRLEEQSFSWLDILCLGVLCLFLAGILYADGYAHY